MKSSEFQGAFKMLGALTCLDDFPMFIRLRRCVGFGGPSMFCPPRPGWRRETSPWPASGGACPLPRRRWPTLQESEAHPTPPCRQTGRLPDWLAGEILQYMPEHGAAVGVCRAWADMVKSHKVAWMTTNWCCTSYQSAQSSTLTPTTFLSMINMKWCVRSQEVSRNKYSSNIDLNMYDAVTVILWS